MTLDVQHLASTPLLRVVPPPDEVRPRVRAECAGGPRPCPWVSCRYSLYLDVKGNGSITFNHPDLELWELEETCALDVADRGGEDGPVIGRLLNVSPQRVMQVARAALERARRVLDG